MSARALFLITGLLAPNLIPAYQRAANAHFNAPAGSMFLDLLLHSDHAGDVIQCQVEPVQILVICCFLESISRGKWNK